MFLLPHIGSATFETRAAMGYRAIANLEAIFLSVTGGADMQEVIQVLRS